MTPRQILVDYTISHIFRTGLQDTSRSGVYPVLMNFAKNQKAAIQNYVKGMEQESQKYTRLYNDIYQGIHAVLNDPAKFQEMCSVLSTDSLISIATHGLIRVDGIVELYHHGCKMGEFNPILKGKRHPEYYWILANVQAWTSIDLNQLDNHAGYVWYTQKPRGWVNIMTVWNVDDEQLAALHLIQSFHCIIFSPLNDVILLDDNGLPLGYYIQDFDGKAWTLVERHTKNWYMGFHYQMKNSTMVFRIDRDKPERGFWTMPTELIDLTVTWLRGDGSQDGEVYSIVKEMWEAGVWDGAQAFTLIHPESIKILMDTYPKHKTKIMVYYKGRMDAESKWEYVISPRMINTPDLPDNLDESQVSEMVQEIEQALYDNYRVDGNVNLTIYELPRVYRLLKRGLITAMNLVAIPIGKTEIEIRLSLFPDSAQEIEKLRGDFVKAMSLMVAAMCDFHATKISTYSLSRFKSDMNALFRDEPQNSEHLMMDEVYRKAVSMSDSIMTGIFKEAMEQAFMVDDSFQIESPFEKFIHQKYISMRGVSTENVNIEQEIVSVASWDLARKTDFNNHEIMEKTNQIIELVIRKALQTSEQHMTHWQKMKADERLVIVRATRSRATMRNRTDKRPDYLNKVVIND